jgi:chromosome segregation protein
MTEAAIVCSTVVVSTCHPLSAQFDGARNVLSAEAGRSLFVVAAAGTAVLNVSPSPKISVEVCPMPHARGMHPGAVWKKCDFQVHTPRDTQWEGLRLPGGTPEYEQAREAWADGFVAECLRRGLGALAVTDHHDFCFVPYVQRAITRASAQTTLWLFPGTEVTCNDAVQCLVLFDADTGEADWDRLFGGHLPAIGKASCDLETLPQAILCGKEIAVLVDALMGDAVLSSKVIPLPHASDEGAHKSMMRQGFHERFKNLNCDGVYTDKPIQNLEKKYIDRIHGEIQAWGNRRRGILPTSDSRRADFQRLGVNACWIRLGEPTVEAIRQALLADEARITYSEPALPAQRVRELRVNSTLSGQGFQLHINDGFTAIIGGRGSGKSAVLEYLRFGLGRSTADVSDGPEYQRQRDLIAETLANGSVTVILERNGVLEKWTRLGAQPDVIAVDVVGSARENINIVAAQQRFRARAFSQKQLSSLVSSAEDAAEQITGIAAAEEIDQRQALEGEIARAKRDIAVCLDRVVDSWAAQGEHALAASAVKDLERRLEASRKKLEESGLSEASQKVLDDAPAHNSAQDLLLEARASLESDLDALRRVSEEIPSIDADLWQKLSRFDEIEKFNTKLATQRAEIQGHFAAIRSSIEALQSARQTAESDFSARFAEFKAKHDLASREKSNLAGLVSESARL